MALDFLVILDCKTMFKVMQTGTQTFKGTHNRTHNNPEGNLNDLVCHLVVDYDLLVVVSYNLMNKENYKEVFKFYKKRLYLRVIF